MDLKVIRLNGASPVVLLIMLLLVVRVVLFVLVVADDRLLRRRHFIVVCPFSKETQGLVTLLPLLLCYCSVVIVFCFWNKLSCVFVPSRHALCFSLK